MTEFENSKPIQVILSQTEENNDKEFSFSDVFAFIKKGMPRLLIFCLVAVVISGILCTTLYFTSSKTNVQTIFDYNYVGIEKGEDPFGKALDTGAIKSPSVITRTLKALDLTNVDQELLRNSIEIIGIVPKDVADKINLIKEMLAKDPKAAINIDLKYFPSRYVVSINNIKKLGINVKTGRNILDQLLIQYQSYFKEMYGNLTSLSTTITNIDYSEYDFIEIFDLFDSQINSIERYLAAKVLQAPTFRSNVNGMAFNDLIENINFIKQELTGYETFISLNAISKDIDFAMSYMTNSLAKLEIDKKTKTAEAESLKETIKEYKKDIITILPGGTTDGIEQSISSKKYDELIDKHTLANAQLQSLEAQVAKLTNRIASFKKSIDDPTIITGPADLEKAELKAKKLQTRLLAELEQINSVVDEYQNSVVLSNAVKISSPAVSSKESSFSLKYSAVIVFGFVVVACIVSLSITKINMNKIKKK